jgi:hypothetical protein
MTPQEIFDTVARHLIAQGRQAKDEGGNCVYRAEDGSKCAVGCLITDEEYVPSMETVVFGQREAGTERQIAWPPRLLAHKRLLHVLQDVHDDHWDNLHDELFVVAERFKLSTDVLR